MEDINNKTYMPSPIARQHLLEEYGFLFLEEFGHGMGVWVKDRSEAHFPIMPIWLFSKPYGSFTQFSLVIAATQEAAEKNWHNDFIEDYLTFKIESEQQLRTILSSLL